MISEDFELLIIEHVKKVFRQMPNAPLVSIEEKAFKDLAIDSLEQHDDYSEILATIRLQVYKMHKKKKDDEE